MERLRSKALHQQAPVSYSRTQQKNQVKYKKYINQAKERQFCQINLEVNQIEIYLKLNDKYFFFA